MPEAAVIAWTVFFLVCVVWRFWYQQRLTSDFGLRGMPGKIGSIAWFGGILVALSYVVLSLAPVLEVAGWIDRSYAPRWQVAIGVAALAAGIAVTSVAQVQMGPSWRVGLRLGERTPLVTTGVFGVVRNPIFSGVLLAALGGTLLVPRWATLLATLAAVVGIEIQVRCVEEPYLRSIHGAAFRAYAARVGRFVPGLGRHDAKAD